MATTELRPRLGFDRYVELIEQEARHLAGDLRGADLTTSVPSCPGWNLAQLTTHVGEELRWLEGMVRTRAPEMADDTALRQLDPVPARDGAATGAWIVEGAEALGATMRAAGPDATLWSPFPGERSIGFHARRFAHEGALHRSDAALALGRRFALDRDAALDAVAEWMEHGQHPAMAVYHPERAALLGPDRVLRVEIDDVADDPDAAWRIDLTGAAPAYRPATPHDGPGPAVVTARGSVLDVLLVLYRRRDPGTLAIEGDRGLLDEWLGASAFA